jgi:tRNA dimethylallyltransferase
MLARGWLDEVRALAGHVPPEAPAWQAAGYGAWRQHLNGALAFDAARERTVIETRQYAKRQRTWFRHQLAHGRVVRVDPHAPDAWDRVLAWWSHRGGAPRPNVGPVPRHHAPTEERP